MYQATFVQEGGAIDHTPVADVAAGAVVVQTNLVGTTSRPIPANTLGTLATRGVFDFVQDASAKDAGAAIYWDADGNPVGGVAGSGAATTTANGNTFMGYAVKASLNTDGTVRVDLFGAPAVTVNHYGPLNNAIADPGDAQAIPVTASGHIDIVTAGAETRTLAAPGFAGQELLISMKTDGGDCVIAIATTVNQTGNNRITLNDAGDAVRLAAKQNGANLRWSVVSNDGATLSTV